MKITKEQKIKLYTNMVRVRKLDEFIVQAFYDKRLAGRVVIVDEDVARCGVTAELGMQITEKAFDYLKAPVQRVAAANLPIPAGVLEQCVLPQPQDIARAITKIVR